MALERTVDQTVDNHATDSLQPPQEDSHQHTPLSTKQVCDAAPCGGRGNCLERPHSGVRLAASCEKRARWKHNLTSSKAHTPVGHDIPGSRRAAMYHSLTLGVAPVAGPSAQQKTPFSFPFLFFCTTYRMYPAPRKRAQDKLYRVWSVQRRNAQPGSLHVLVVGPPTPPADLPAPIPLLCTNKSRRGQ